MASDRESLAQAIASGTQDLAALAGLFSTDSVEQNALATHLGPGAVLVSSLSLLGILGLVKSTMKIVLGLERCRAAGFKLDAVRGLFGYAAGETAATGEMVDCDLITMEFLEDKIMIHKIKRLLDSVRSPIVVVGSGWPELGLLWKTAVNLGNVRREAAFSQSPWYSFSFGMLYTGVTAWLLLVIDTPWTWVRLLATAGLQACLVFMLGLPLWFQRQTGRPGAHLTPVGWTRLWDLPDDFEPPRDERGSWWMTTLHATWKYPWNCRLLRNFIYKRRNKCSTSTKMNLLQARVAEGDVLHFQGDVSLLKSRVLGTLVLIVSVGTVAAYVCQYAIVATASNRQAIMWVSCQAFAALVRVLYWMINPSFDDPQTNKGEFALVNNRERQFIFLPELLCACEPGLTDLPLWVWYYLKDTTLDEVFQTAAGRTEHDVVPIDIAPGNLCILLNVNFDRIVERRQDGYNNGYANRSDPKHRDHKWRLAFWRESASPSDPVHPVILVEIPFVQDKKRERECWMETAAHRVHQGDRTPGNPARILNTCTIFAVSKDGQRLHLRSHTTPEACDNNCPRSSQWLGDLEHSDTILYVYDRSNMCHWIKSLFEKDIYSGGLGYSHANTWQHAVWVSITPDTIDRNGNSWEGPRKKIFGERDWMVGLRTVRDYIGGKYNPSSPA